MDILQVRFRTDSEFKEYYQTDLPSGGLFCPTTTQLAPGQNVVVEVSAPSLPNRVLIRAKVLSWRPALPRLRVRAGAIIEFSAEEHDKRDFLMRVMSGELSTPSRRKHTRLPVELPIQYRTNGSADMLDCTLSEISVGGATLETSTCLPIDTDVIIEITPPGSVRPISISGKSIYHLPNGGTGLKFIYRDSGGSRRLKELIRRLRND